MLKTKIFGLVVFSALFSALFSGSSYATTDVQYERMAEQLSKQLQASLKVMNDPKLIKANAKYMKNLYDALLKEGFTKDQALTLVAASLASKK